MAGLDEGRLKSRLGAGGAAALSINIRSLT